MVLNLDADEVTTPGHKLMGAQSRVWPKDESEALGALITEAIALRTDLNALTAAQRTLTQQVTTLSREVTQLNKTLTAEQISRRDVDLFIQSQHLTGAENDAQVVVEMGSPRIGRSARRVAQSAIPLGLIITVWELAQRLLEFLNK